MVHQRIFQINQRITPLCRSLGSFLPSFVRRCFTGALLAAFLLFLNTNISYADSVPIDLRVSDSFQVRSALVLDLRTQPQDGQRASRKAFLQSLDEYGEIALLRDPEARSILARKPYSRAKQEALEALEHSSTAFAALDCPRTQKQIRKSVGLLAQAQAQDMDVAAPLYQAYLYSFLCADRMADTDAAMLAAAMLAALTAGARPKEISESNWRKYPILDAQSNLGHQSVTIQSSPGAVVWVDHQKRGNAPLTLLLPEGEHIFAAAGPQGSTHLRSQATTEIVLDLQPQETKWGGLPALVQEVSESFGPVYASSMRSLLVAVEAEIAFVIKDPFDVEIWILPKRRRDVIRVGLAEPIKKAGRMALRALKKAERSPGLDPTMPLLREEEVPEEAEEAPTRWWIYGVVLGAAAAGAGIILLQDLREDRQNIEVVFP